MISKTAHALCLHTMIGNQMSVLQTEFKTKAAQKNNRHKYLKSAVANFFKVNVDELPIAVYHLLSTDAILPTITHKLIDSPQHNQLFMKSWYEARFNEFGKIVIDQRTNKPCVIKTFNKNFVVVKDDWEVVTANLIKDQFTSILKEHSRMMDLSSRRSIYTEFGKLYAYGQQVTIIALAGKIRFNFVPQSNNGYDPEKHTNALTNVKNAFKMLPIVSVCDAKDGAVVLEFTKEYIERLVTSIVHFTVGDIKQNFVVDVNKPQTADDYCMKKEDVKIKSNENLTLKEMLGIINKQIEEGLMSVKALETKRELVLDLIG